MDKSVFSPASSSKAVLDQVVQIAALLVDVERGFFNGHTPLKTFNAAEVLNLKFGLQRAFSINVSDAELSKCATLGDVARMVILELGRYKENASQIASEKQNVQDQVLNLVNCSYNNIEFVKLPYRQTYDIKLYGRRLFVDNVNVAGYNIRIVTIDGVEKFRSVDGMPADNHAIIQKILDACEYRYQKER